jgi:hypothetical protein
VLFSIGCEGGSVSVGGGGWKCCEPNPPGYLRACPGLYRDIPKFPYFTHDFQAYPFNTHTTKCDSD